MCSSPAHKNTFEQRDRMISTSGGCHAAGAHGRSCTSSKALGPRSIDLQQQVFNKCCLDLDQGLVAAAWTQVVLLLSACVALRHQRLHSERAHAADRRRAEKIKSEANELFSKSKYNAAIERYTEAITLAPSYVVLYANRALCHRRLEQWKLCEADARRALALSSSHMKVRPGHAVAPQRRGLSARALVLPSARHSTTNTLRG